MKYIKNSYICILSFENSVMVSILVVDSLSPNQIELVHKLGNHISLFGSLCGRVQWLKNIKDLHPVNKNHLY